MDSVTLKEVAKFSHLDSASGEKLKIEGTKSMRTRLHNSISHTFHNICVPSGKVNIILFGVKMSEGYKFLGI